MRPPWEGRVIKWVCQLYSMQVVVVLSWVRSKTESYPVLVDSDAVASVLRQLCHSTPAIDTGGKTEYSRRGGAMVCWLYQRLVGRESCGRYHHGTSGMTCDREAVSRVQVCTCQR